MRAVLAISLSYLCGSIPFGVLLARHRGVNLRDIGSGNIGATNVARALGRRWALLVLILDAAKAALPVLLAGAAHDPPDEWLRVSVAAAAFIGHLFPLFLGFRGGKGVASALGAFLVLQPHAALLGALTYAAAYALSRTSSVGSLSAVLLFPLWLWRYHAPTAHWAFAAFVLVLIVLRHRGNIQRLLRREEPRV